MELTDIKKILIVGGGTMGQQIGFQCAAHGYNYVDQGWLGVKSGRGFYTYPHPTYQNPDFVQGE